MPNLSQRLKAFADKHGFRGKGPLCVALVVTRHARELGLPLDSSALLTAKGGQVLGLGKNAVQGILKHHGIARVLAAEGGRTSRGSIQNMQVYVRFLNELPTGEALDLDKIEAFWIERVQAFFAGQPFRLKLDASRSLRSIVSDVLRQAIERQKSSPGMHYSGAVIQHLVGAKLECVLGRGKIIHREFPRTIDHHSFSTADAPSGREGDFGLGDVAIHVTTTPGETVIMRCKDNIESGLKPILVTMRNQVLVAAALAENAGLGERIDVFEVEQFIALNVYEMGSFTADGRESAITDLIDSYNAVIELVETDPSLKIECR